MRTAIQGLRRCPNGLPGSFALGPNQVGKVLYSLCHLFPRLLLALVNSTAEDKTSHRFVACTRCGSRFTHRWHSDIWHCHGCGHRWHRDPLWADDPIDLDDECGWCDYDLGL